MKTLIIEDEKAALRNLKAVIGETAADLEIVGETDSVLDTVQWFKDHPMPDLVFMDIHLADGSAFEIFEYVAIKCPIIFTTAYDEYALKAFKVNSIAYLLKPISCDDLQAALDKLEELSRRSSQEAPKSDLAVLMRELKRKESYRTYFLIPVKGDRLVPVSVENILFFYISDGVVKAVDEGNVEIVFPQSLDELAEQLDPVLFFRANRQFLISKKAVKDISLWFNGRLAVNLKVPFKERIIIRRRSRSLRIGFNGRSGGLDFLEPDWKENGDVWSS